jgi:hypothetical protein
MNFNNSLSQVKKSGNLLIIKLVKLGLLNLSHNSLYEQMQVLFAIA